jgi:hypothetical protein
LFFVGFYFVGFFLRKIISQKLRQRLAAKEIVTFVSDLIFYVFIILGFTLGLANIGVNVNTIIAQFWLRWFCFGFCP